MNIILYIDIRIVSPSVRVGIWSLEHESSVNYYKYPRFLWFLLQWPEGHAGELDRSKRETLEVFEPSLTATPFHSRCFFSFVMISYLFHFDVVVWLFHCDLCKWHVIFLFLVRRPGEQRQKPSAVPMASFAYSYGVKNVEAGKDNSVEVKQLEPVPFMFHKTSHGTREWSGDSDPAFSTPSYCNSHFPHKATPATRTSNHRLVPACPHVCCCKKSLASIHPPFPQKMAQPDSFPFRNSDHQVLFLQFL